MEETESNVFEGRRQTAPFLKTCDNEYVTLGIEKSGQLLWFICFYTLMRTLKRKVVSRGRRWESEKKGQCQLQIEDVHLERMRMGVRVIVEKCKSYR